MSALSSSPSPTRSAPTTTTTAKPLLLLFASRRDGRSRRVEGFIAHVLQRRHNHDSFKFRIVLEEDRPDLFERFSIEDVPTVMVVADKQVRRRVSGDVRPHALEEVLAPWLH